MQLGTDYDMASCSSALYNIQFKCALTIFLIQDKFHNSEGREVPHGAVSTEKKDNIRSGTILAKTQFKPTDNMGKMEKPIKNWN